MMTATTTRTTRTRTTTETLTTTATGTTTRTRTTTTTRTTTRTRKAPAAASEPEVPPSPPAAPAQEAGPPAEAAPPRPEASKPTAPRSPWADKDPKDQDQDVPPAPAEKTEVFEGVRIRVGSVHPRGGYVHWRSRRQVLSDSLDIGILPEVLHHPDLMTDGHKPSATAYKRAEKLIVQVKRAKERGEDPAPLWKRWLPPVARKRRKAA